MTLNELTYLWGTTEKTVRYKKHACMFLAGLVLSLIGPYDTSGIAEHGMRVSYWVSLLLLASFVSGPVMRMLEPRLGHIKNLWGAMLIFCALISLPVFVMVISYDLVLGPGGSLSLERVISFLPSISFLGYLYWFIQVLTITLLVVAIITFGYGSFSKKKDEEKADGPAARPGQLFLNRLPKEIGTDLLCLNMEDHYVRAYTSKGNALILMRFGDAVTELEGYPGQQTHRSWWVAYDAISHTRRDKRRHVAHLANDMDVPVSQTYTEQMKAAGFI